MIFVREYSNLHL